MLLCKVREIWSFQTQVPVLTDLKQTQLSNPQKCQSDCIKKKRKEKKKKKLGRRKEVKRIWVNGHPSWGLGLNTLQISA